MYLETSKPRCTSTAFTRMSEDENRPPKRRRVLDPSTIVPVPVYSNKVSSSLHLKPPAALFTEDETTDDVLLAEFSRGKTSVVQLSDSDDDGGVEEVKSAGGEAAAGAARCSSPSPPQSPVQQPSRKAQQKIRELDRNLQVVYSLMSPEALSRPSRTRRGQRASAPQRDQDAEDDVIIVSPASEAPQSSPHGSSVREIPLKVRCRTEVHKVLVLSSTCLSAVVTQLSVLLEVPPTRLLLLRGDVELPMDSTVGELGLGIADIIECAVMAAEEEHEATDGGDIITVKLQSKDRDSCQEVSLPREAPLGSIFSQYVSQFPAGAQKNVRFHFDGCKVTKHQTPAQLDMEDGDIIEVWM